MSEKIDYSKYECPYSHLEKECGHELHSPEGYQDIYSVWCQCGFRAPVFYLDPIVLGLKLKGRSEHLCVDCLKLPATHGIGDTKTLCIDCWNKFAGC